MTAPTTASREEHDRARAAIRKYADGSWLLSGLLRPDEISKQLAVFLPDEDEVETLGGLVVQRLGRIPKVGDSVEVQAVDRDGDQLTANLKVERMDGHRTDRVRMTLSGDDDPTDSEKEARS